VVVTRRAALLAGGAAIVAVGAAAAVAATSSGGDGAPAASPRDVVLGPSAAERARDSRRARRSGAASHARAVRIEGAAAPPAEDPNARDAAPSPGAASDSEVRAQLREANRQLVSFRAHLADTAFVPEGPRARVLRSGFAVAPSRAPDVVKQVILAGNEIARFPYKWGGGHGAWRDVGYDCSGSVSFALAGAGLLDRPLTSGGLARYGAAGTGRWITIYANAGHVFMLVAGLRFDTSGQGRAGTRWQPAARPVGGFAVRHPPGL
jgi:hypothetical protein